MKSKQKQGKSNRARGKTFELKVRAIYEKQGFVVCKWANQVDLIQNKLIPAKSKYNPFLKRVMNEGSGFPDFLIFKPGAETEVIGVECKLGKYLDKVEKAKVKWLLEKQIFKEIIVVYRQGHTIIYNHIELDSLLDKPLPKALESGSEAIEEKL